MPQMDAKTVGVRFPLRAFFQQVIHNANTGKILGFWSFLEKIGLFRLETIPYFLNQIT